MKNLIFLTEKDIMKENKILEKDCLLPRSSSGFDLGAWIRIIVIEIASKRFIFKIYSFNSKTLRNLSVAFQNILIQMIPIFILLRRKQARIRKRSYKISFSFIIAFSVR